MHVNLSAHIRESFDEIGFAGDELPVERARSSVVDRDLMKITRPEVKSDVRYVHAQVLLSLIDSGIGKGRSKQTALEDLRAGVVPENHWQDSLPP